MGCVAAHIFDPLHGKGGISVANAQTPQMDAMVAAPFQRGFCFLSSVMRPKGRMKADEKTK